MTGRVRFTAAWLLVISLLVVLWLLVRDPPRTQVGGETEAAAEALNAWAGFANTGELAEVSDFFAINGPQFEMLATEAVRIETGEPYSFELTNAELVAEGVVRGIVTVSRHGEPNQVFRWDIELVREGHRWKLWTVRTSPSSIPNADLVVARHPEH
jgi:hypothetical protein